jgi:hypothetical protein
MQWTRFNTDHATETEGKKQMIEKLPPDLQVLLIEPKYHNRAGESSLSPFLSSWSLDTVLRLKELLKVLLKLYKGIKALLRY